MECPIQVTTVRGSLHVQSWGNPRHPCIILIHGFPDHSAVWSDIAQNLCDSFYVLAYDVRGAGRSSPGQSLADYTLPALSDDLFCITNQLIPNRDWHLVGHDWGSIQGWAHTTDPRLKPHIRSFTSISGPSLDHLGYWLRLQASPRKLLRQLLKSWYIGMFHLPLLPERIWPGIARHLLPIYLQYREGLECLNPSQLLNNGLHGMNLYRANIMNRLIQPQPKKTTCPVQLIVPLQDDFVDPHLVEISKDWVADRTLIKLSGGHWIIRQQHQYLAQEISTFINRISASPAWPALN